MKDMGTEEDRDEAAASETERNLTTGLLLLPSAYLLMEVEELGMHITDIRGSCYHANPTPTKGDISAQGNLKTISYRSNIDDCGESIRAFGRVASMVLLLSNIPPFSSCSERKVKQQNVCSRPMRKECPPQN